MKIEYKKLAEEIKKKGMYYKINWRDNDFAIYSCGSSKTPFLGYECFEVQRHNGFEIAGKKIEPTEFYPSDEAFGVTAFFCRTLERAKLRLEQLRDLKRMKDEGKLPKEEME